MLLPCIKRETSEMKILSSGTYFSPHSPDLFMKLWLLITDTVLVVLPSETPSKKCQLLWNHQSALSRRLSAVVRLRVYTCISVKVFSVCVRLSLNVPLNFEPRVQFHAALYTVLS